jgi:uncharacterized protein YdaU (DUF1376 family)
MTSNCRSTTKHRIEWRGNNRDGEETMQRPWMPFWPGDYLADTQHLETVQHGAYLLLILHYWDTGKPLPDDDRQLATITKLPLHSWRAMRPKLQAFFHDGWHHKRIDSDIIKIDKVIAARKRAGSKGGTVSAIARWSDKQTGKQTLSKAVSKTEANVELLEEDKYKPVSGTAREGLGNGTAELVELVAAKGWK